MPEVIDTDRIAALQRAGANTTGMMPRMADVYRSEEKGTDVNLAVHLVVDAHRGRFDAAIVVSNDSDLEGAVRIVRMEIGLPVFVFHPPTNHPSDKLNKVATRFRSIEPRHLINSQFPSTLTDARGMFAKPPTW